MTKATLFRLVSRFALHPWFRLTRGSTLGVRAAVIDAEGRSLLVQHSYAPGWMFPGGGVERGETAYDAVRRELHEEAGIVIEGEPLLHGVFANHQQFYGRSSRLFPGQALSPGAVQAIAGDRGGAVFCHRETCRSERPAVRRRRIAEIRNERAGHARLVTSVIYPRVAACDIDRALMTKAPAISAASTAQRRRA